MGTVMLRVSSVASGSAARRFWRTGRSTCAAATCSASSGLARLKGLEASRAAGEVRRWFERVDLTHAADRRVEQLSTGQQQKIQIVTAFIGDPDLLVRRSCRGCRFRRVASAGVEAPHVLRAQNRYGAIEIK